MTLSPSLVDRRGFSLVEMLIVIVMISLMTAIALPKMIAIRQGAVLDSAAQQLAGDLRRAQTEAIKRNAYVTLTRTGGSTYTIQHIGGREFSAGVTFDGSSVASVQLAPMGPPIGGGGTFALLHAGRQKSVVISAAGLVSVQ